MSTNDLNQPLVAHVTGREGGNYACLLSVEFHREQANKIAVYLHGNISHLLQYSVFNFIVISWKWPHTILTRIRIELSSISTLSLPGTLFLSLCGSISITRDNVYILNILAPYALPEVERSIQLRKKQTNKQTKDCDQERVGYLL